MAERYDISLHRGETLDLSIPIEGIVVDDMPCELAMSVRISHKGREFARISSFSGNLYVDLEGDQASVRVFAPASTFSGIVSLKYKYSIYGLCNDRKRVLAHGTFDLEDNLVHSGDLDDVGSIVTETGTTVAAPSIVSVNTADSLCCGIKDTPLFFEVFTPGGAKDIYLDTTFGEYTVESYSRGKWHSDRQKFSGNDATRHRVKFVRFPKHPLEDFDDFGKPMLVQGGVTSCSGCVDYSDCDPFSVRITAIDNHGQSASASFPIEVDGESIPTVVTTPYLIDVAGCDDNCGTASILTRESLQSIVANGCSVSPGFALMTDACATAACLAAGEIVANGCSVSPGLAVL